MTLAILNLNPEKGERHYAIGDIHGCMDELTALEKKIHNASLRAGCKKYKIISVGDLFDRGPNVKSVVEHFVEGKRSGTHELILGNHETFLILALIGLRPDLLAAHDIHLTWFHRAFEIIFPRLTSQVDVWRANGGAPVFQSYDASIDDVQSWDQIPKDHIELIFSAPLIVKTPTAIISHAFIHPGDLEAIELCDTDELNASENVYESLIRCLWDRSVPNSRIDTTRRHISGHTPIPKVTRYKKQGAIQIDTGAVYGQTLSAVDLINFRTLSVPSNFSCK